MKIEISKNLKRIISVAVCMLLIFDILPAHDAFAWEEETHCEYCGKFIADDWICSGGDHCSEDADGGCYDEHHCPECRECVDELCPDCGLCKNCDNHCLNCDECVSNTEICEDCGYCDNCAIDNGIHCPECNECAYAGAVLCKECGRCGSCGGECYEGIESCGYCLECHISLGKICTSCEKCFMSDDSGLCPGCGLCKECVMEWCDVCELCVECAVEEKTHCEDCESCLFDMNNVCAGCNKCIDCAKGNLDWCDLCDVCLECAVEAGDHCPECKNCFAEVEECMVCNRCLDCGGGMCSDHHTEMCMECHLDMGRACRQCHKCYGDESEDTAACSECGRCADCVGDDICENCHMCVECATDNGKHCKNCGRCEADVDVLCANCGLCGDCGGECSNKCADMCLECHVDSENACPDCGKCYILGGGVGHVGCTECYLCDECTLGICEDCGMCFECAAEQKLHCPSCYECHNNAEICEECKEACENCADQWCGNCHMCLNCAKEQKGHCPECGVCGDDEDLCPECGKCESCSDNWCSDCGMCLECHDGKDLCAECGEACIANSSPCGGHCEDCLEELKCPECERCAECEDFGMCDECGICTECAVEAGDHCPECKRHYNINYVKCEICNMCTDCAFYNHDWKHCDNECGACENNGAKLCPKCGWCSNCMGDDWCEACNKCLSTCHEADEICKKCGDCIINKGVAICPECDLCSDCCEANSKAAGCDHGVCINSDEWTGHWNSEHGSEEHTHVYNWEYNAYQHHKECVVAGCKEEYSWEAHRYGEWVVVTEPTETADGMRSRVCLDCGRCDEESVKATNPGHTHSFGNWQNDTDGHWKQCECGERTDAEAHTLGGWIIDVPATETESGAKHKECTVCGRVTVREIIPATGYDHVHSYGEMKFDAESHWKECECGIKNELAAHSFVWVTDKAANKAESGIKHEECSVCGYKRGENTVIPRISEGDPIKITAGKHEEYNPSTGAQAPKMGALAVLFGVALLLKKHK